MKLVRPLAATGVALAAVAATLGAVAPAQAAGINATYSCDFPMVGAQDLTLTVNGALPTTAAAGIPVAAGLLHLPVSAHTTAAARAVLSAVQADGAVVNDFASTIGTTVVKVPAKFGAGTPAGDGGIDFSGEGVNQAFLQPAAGTYDITLPKSFTVVATKGGTPVGSALCTTATPVKLGSIAIDKQLAHVSAKAGKKAVKAKKAKLAVAVANDWSAKGGVVPTGGQVVVKKGKKVVGKATLVNGKATVKLKKLKKGTNKLTVSYAGDGYTAAGKLAKAVKVKVK